MAFYRIFQNVFVCSIHTTTLRRRIEKMATTANDVLLFIPNIIGYTRVLMTLLAYYFALPGNEEAFAGLQGWQVCMICYSISFVADAVDGMAARHFKQCSDFGAVLDMVTDRCSTAGFLLILSHLYVLSIELADWFSAILTLCCLCHLLSVT